ncbi:MAG: hypothetical protein L0154_24935 [Chloroflexi bacterium]|nr:hypothetical protein [Chloroflexota bacterium]
MKTVSIIGFLGTGIRDVRYQQEQGLIQLGHVGLAFEGVDDLILGFHPSLEAIEAIGGQEAAMKWLRNRKAGNRLDGCLQNDLAIFERAYVISQSNPQTTVWEKVLELEDDTFETLRNQAIEWYNEKRIFPYALPLPAREIDWDNCATFPRRLGLELPEASGQLQRYIPALQAAGKRWKPKGSAS